MKTETIYVRASPALREGIEEFRKQQDLTLSSAAADLLERGLQAVADEQSVRELEAEATRLKQALAVQSVELNQTRARAAALAGVEGQLKAIVAQCGKCQHPLTICDLFFARTCPNCSIVLDPFKKPAETNPAAAAVLGGIAGLVFGLAAGSQAAS